MGSRAAALVVVDDIADAALHNCRLPSFEYGLAPILKSFRLFFRNLDYQIAVWIPEWFFWRFGIGHGTRIRWPDVLKTE